MTRKEEIKLLIELRNAQKKEELEIKKLKEELISISEILGLKNEIYSAVYGIRLVK